MTKEEALRKALELFDDHARDIFKKRVKFALLTGAINLKKFEDNDQLPIILFCDALAELKANFEPRGKEALRKELKNLRHF